MSQGNNADVLKAIRLNITKKYKIYISTVDKTKPSEIFIVLLEEIKTLSQMGFSISSIREIILKATEYEFKYDTLYVLFQKHTVNKNKKISILQQIIIKTRQK